MPAALTSFRLAATDADLTAINTLFTKKVAVSGSGATVTYGAKTMTDTSGAFLSLPGTIVGQTITVGAKVGTIASVTATVVTLTANWTGGAPAAGSAYLITPGFSIVDELLAEGWPSTIPFTLAVWHPIMVASATNYIIMGFDSLNNLRGAGWWAFNGDSWEVRLLGIDKTLSSANRTQGLSDCFQWNAARVPGVTKFIGTAKVGGRIDQYLGSRLPASARLVVTQTNMAMFHTTATEALALLK